MKLSDFTQDELECMGYDEIAHLILLESGKKEKLLNLFKKVCKAINLDFDTHSENITDFFELLSTNKKFVMLKNGYWDLQINHKLNVTVEDSEEDIIDIDEEDTDLEDEIIEDETEEDIFYEGNDTDDHADDDLADLVIIDEDEEEANM